MAQIAEKAPDLVVLEKAKSGAWCGKIEGISLCGKYNPVREALSFASGQGIEPGMSVALYGMGLGYHLRPLLDAVGPEGLVVVAEANWAILRAAFKVAGDPELFEDPRLVIISGEDEASFLSSWNRAFGDLDPDKTRIVIHIPSFQALPNGYDRVARAIELIRMERRFPLVMGGLENENFRRNLPLVLKSAGVSSLEGVIKGETAVVVGAGPSLDRDIVYLGACRHATILSSDTALPLLIKNGITPDLVFSIDPASPSLMHFELCERFDLPTVFLPTSSADVVEKSRGNIFFGFRDADRFPEPARGWAKKMGTIGAGGSVSCVALETAFMMGAKTVLLFGQDFSFPDGRAYAQGTVFGILGWEEPEESALTNTQNYFGQKIKTAINLFSYQREFENLAASFSAEVVTLSASGARLAGIEPIPAPWPWIRGSHSRQTVPKAIKQKANPSVEQAFTQWLSR